MRKIPHQLLPGNIIHISGPDGGGGGEDEKNTLSFPVEMKLKWKFINKNAS